MAHEDLHQRLRSLGEQPVPESISSSHLASIASTGSRAAWRTRRFGAAAVAVGLVAAGGVAAAAATTSGPPPRVEVPVAAPFETSDDDTDVVADEGDETDTTDETRTEPPGIERAREAQARAAEESPEGDEGDEATIDDPCVGAPWFAGIFPHADGFAPGERGVQARAFAEFRATECATDDEGDDTIETADDGERRGPPAHAAAPAHGDRPGGPPTDRPVGPPADRPVDPDAPRPVGPPADRPGNPVGPPTGERPSGPPTDRPAGPPAESGPESDDE